jgi:DNA modification methylase
VSIKIINGNCRAVLAALPAESVHCVVTSPPYWGLRDYGIGKDAFGIEPTVDLYVRNAIEIFRAVHRVLRPDGTLWLNLGDSYAHGGCGARDAERWPKQSRNDHRVEHTKTSDFKPKDLCGIPWRIAFALQADGWYLRQDIIWAKPNPMPESVTDRCTKAHEYLFLLTKSARYFFDAKAIKEDVTGNAHPRTASKQQASAVPGAGPHKGLHRNGRPPGVNPKRLLGVPGMMRSNPTFTANELVETRNKRSVWTVATFPFPEAHFATFPPKLIEPCILAGCPIFGTVLDPFGGAGTTGLVARRNARNAILIELNSEYVEIARKRIGLYPWE